MEHYFSAKPTSSQQQKTITYRLGTKTFEFFTSSSVFSKDHVDRGSDLLLSKTEISEKSKVLDIGCGYGVVGIVVKTLHPSTTVICSDVNQRALSLTKKNASRKGVAIDVKESDLFSAISDTFDVILSNPPQHAGKKVCFALIEGAFSHLKKGGSLQLVARHQKGGKSLSKHMEEVFGNVSVLGRGSGFRVYCSRK